MDEHAKGKKYLTCTLSFSLTDELNKLKITRPKEIGDPTETIEKLVGEHPKVQKWVAFSTESFCLLSITTWNLNFRVKPKYFQNCDCDCGTAGSFFTERFVCVCVCVCLCVCVCVCVLLGQTLLHTGNGFLCVCACATPWTQRPQPRGGRSSATETGLELSCLRTHRRRARHPWLPRRP